MKSISTSSSGSELPPPLAVAASELIAPLKPADKCPPSSNRPHSETAVSNAWPDADDDGGKSTVPFSARQRSNSCTTGTGELCRYASAASRFSGRTRKSVAGPASVAGALKSFSSRASSPHISAAGCCNAWFVTLSARRSQPATPARCAPCASSCAAPSRPSAASAWPCSSKAGPFLPALAMTLASTARKCMGTSRPPTSITKPRTTKRQTHGQRFLMFSFGKI